MSDAFVVAAVIPLYNGHRFIFEAIASVLNQTRIPDEIIVVDDGSTNPLGAQIVEAFIPRDKRVRLLRKPNGGQSSARNFGVAHFTATHIAFLDQDDRWYPGHVEALLRPFKKKRDGAPLGWVHSNVDEIDEGGNLVCKSILSVHGKDRAKPHLFDCLSDDLFITPSATLISRASFDAVGGFDERLCGYEDDDLFLRLFRAGYDSAYLNASLSQWRIYGSSTSFTPRMRQSRDIYARKLMAAFPDNPARNLYITRDLIGPRFARLNYSDLLHGLATHDIARVDGALSSLRPFSKWLRQRQRIVVMLASILLRARLLRLPYTWHMIDAYRTVRR
jgi:glycosyltransferase involved in cell wall biosynthesis